ncbi:MAG: hypothetical protein NTZ92_06090 [Candidatus Omnitrophica bacterium]|nr:hypothetical protein [Candidatus Omnitrophota bacterium]
MIAKPARLLILVLIIVLSLLSSRVEAEDYYSGNPYSSPEPSSSDNQAPNNSYNNSTVISSFNPQPGGVNNIPNSYNNSTVISSFNSQPSAAYKALNSSNNSMVIGSLNSQSGAAYKAPSNYNSYTVISPFSYNTSSQPGGGYNNSGSITSYPNSYNNSTVTYSFSYNTPSQPGGGYNNSGSMTSYPSSYNNPMLTSPSSYTTPSQSAEAYDNSESIYSSSASLSNYNSATNTPNYDNTVAQSAPTIYNDLSEAIYNSPVVTQAEKFGLSVEKIGGGVGITPYDPVKDAVVSALNEGYESVVVTGEGVLIPNPIQGDKKSVVIDNNNPSLIGPNGLYSTYRSTADLLGDISSHDAKVAAAAYTPTSVAQPTGMLSNYSPAPVNYKSDTPTSQNYQYNVATPQVEDPQIKVE